MNTSMVITLETKEKIGEIKKRIRCGTYRETLDFLVSLYEQLAPPKRGEEIEFVEAVEKGKAKAFLRDKLCGGCSEVEEEVKATVRRTDGKEIRSKSKKKIKV